MTVKYSVVIATHNRAQILEKCLSALANQTISKREYEIILTDDGSTDNTNEIVNRFIKNNPEVQMNYTYQENSGPAKARNRGIEYSKGELILFTDDDCIVPTNWIEVLAKQYVIHPEIAGAGGWYEYPPDLYKKSEFVYYSMYSHYRIYGERIKTEEINNNIFLKNPSGNTSNMSYRKDILEKVGGFDETINFVGLVDWELKKRIMDLGYPLLYIPFFVTHLKPLGFKEIIRKFFNRGRGRYHIVKKNPELKNIYTPNFLRTVHRLSLESKRNNSIPYKGMVFISYFFTKLGWKYQKIIEKHQ